MLEVVEADDTAVYGPSVTHVQLGAAQRYSVIVNTDQGKVGDGFWLRTGTDTGMWAALATSCSLGAKEQADQTGCLREGAFAKRNFVVFRYVEKGDETDGQRPETMPW